MNKEASQASVYNTAYYIGYIMWALYRVKNGSMFVLKPWFLAMIKND